MATVMALRVVGLLKLSTATRARQLGTSRYSRRINEFRHFAVRRIDELFFELLKERQATAI